VSLWRDFSRQAAELLPRVSPRMAAAYFCAHAC
jgi:hypothetical protein